MSNAEPKKGFLTQQQFLAVFGVELGTLQRWIKFGLPVEGNGNQKKFDLVQSGQWIVRHFAAGYLSLEQTAEMFGQEVRTITKWKNEFGLPQAAPGFYKRDDVVKWREKHLSTKIKTLQSGGSDGVSANTKLKSAQARRQELNYAKESGRLVEINKVIPVFEKIFSLIAQRRKLYSKRTNPQLDGIDSFGEREKILNDSINELFTGIYESGIRELTRLQQLSGSNQALVEDNSAPRTAARQRVGKKKSNAQRRNRKRTR